MKEVWTLNQYIKKTLLVSASTLMFLSVGASFNSVSARRYRPRTTRHYIKRHYRRNRKTRRVRARRVYKRRIKRSKKRTKRTLKKRWRRIKRYRTGYLDHYGSWHKYAKKARPVRSRAKKLRRRTRRPRRAKRSYYGNRSYKVNPPRRRVIHHHESNAEKIGAARDENFNDTNADRKSVGVDPLQRSSVLDHIAQERSKQLITNNSHFDSNGNWVAKDDLSDAGDDPDIWNGENIMTNWGLNLSGKKSGDQANKQWWTDEAGATPDEDGGHRKNIRNPDFQSVGIGATYLPGTDHWYMCQDFSDETSDQIDNNGNEGNDSSQPNDQGDQGSQDNGGSSSSVVGHTIGGGNGNSNGGASSSSGNGEANVNADGVSVTSGDNGTYINGKKVNPSGTYNEPGGASVTFSSGNVTVRGADGSESSSSL